jgi:thiamine biosynthesis lipoprotein
VTTRADANGSGSAAGAKILLLLSLVLSLVGCAAPAGHRYEFRRPVMGVEARVTLYAPNEDTAVVSADAVFTRLYELDDVMSDWRDGTELMRLCARAGETVAVSDDLFRVLEVAQHVAIDSDGSFDVTVGPLVQLWRTARRDAQLPDAADLEQARSLVGMELMTLDAGAGTVRLEKPGMQLDLGGLGKGFAADEALVTLRRRGIEQAIIDLGGDIVAGAPPPGRTGWRVAVEPRGRTSDTPARSIELANAAVATSGSAYQSVDLGGVRYSHIVDPRTGLGLTHELTVTVIAPDGATADALASAVSVLGAERGRALAARFPGVTLLLDEAGD